EDVQGATAVELAEANSSELVANLNHAATRSPLNVVAWFRGQRSVPVFYDVNDEYAHRFERIISAFEQLCHSQRIWHIAAQGSVDTSYQRKVHGGATSVIERSTVTTIREAPKPMTTNIVVPGFSSTSRSLHLLPDQVLVRER